MTSRWQILPTPKVEIPPAFAEKKKPLIEVLDDSPPLQAEVKSLVPSSKLEAKKSRTVKGGKAARCFSLPPTLDAVIQCRHVFRFQCTTGFSALQNITGGNLAGAIGGYCTTVNSTVKTIASSIRVHRVSVWPAVQSSPQNPPEIVWFSPITIMEKDASRERVLPAGVSVSSAVTEVPPKATICGDWFAVSSGASQPMFGLLNIGAGDVVDVDLSWTITNNLLGSTPAVATGVLGTYYYLYLDGSTTHQLQPIGKPTTF
jgi:hypothetical protein